MSRFKVSDVVKYIHNPEETGRWMIVSIFSDKGYGLVHYKCISDGSHFSDKKGEVLDIDFPSFKRLFAVNNKYIKKEILNRNLGEKE